jgi:hypothetical protein
MGGRVPDSVRILRLLIDEPNGLAQRTIRRRLRLRDDAYDRNRDELLKDDLVERCGIGGGAGLRLTNKGEESITDASAGSGFFVSESGHLLTNHHVTDGFRRIWVTQADGQQSLARVVAEDERADLALLKTTMRPPRACIFRCSDVLLGEDVAVYGFPLSLHRVLAPNFNRGNVTAARAVDPSHMQHSADTAPGSSGGPVVDGSGNVVGVVASGLNASLAQGVNFAIRGSVAIRFLEAHGFRPSKTKKTGFWGLLAGSKSVPQLSWPEVAERAKSFSALVQSHKPVGVDLPADKVNELRNVAVAKASRRAGRYVLGRLKITSNSFAELTSRLLNRFR